MKTFKSFLESLKPINSFKIRTGIHTKFDTGDIITDGKESVIITNITSTSDGVYYLGLDNEYNRKRIEYKKCNTEFELIKKGDEKLQYLIANDMFSSIYDVAIGKEPYPTWFEKEWKIKNSI